MYVRTYKKVLRENTLERNDRTNGSTYVVHTQVQ